ncbi:uncharacterized protein [Nicotiana sylvestris]|uniref:uncharacterized protein n=1 Tax=Nicotiana sylvestris TaxID=4096 RepID=UPI00388C5915
MLARKTVASGALSKILNEQLNASQAQDSNSNSDSESYKSASEGEGHGLLTLRRLKNLLLSGKKSGESGYGETAERLAHLSTQGDEPSSSTEETLVDLLKKVGASYDPKKRRTPTPKVPSAPKPSMKRKASSPTTTETFLPKGRARRSRVKQSREKVTTVEVKTPKPKKPKSSSKKSSSMSEATEPSLAKKTRSAVKSKQVRVSKDEEWSGEEENETDGEHDKLAMFGKRKF